MKLEDAIKQAPFVNQHIRAAVNLSYTVARLANYENNILKPFHLSIQQYNILRILKGQRGNAIGIKEIGQRMIDQMSNASRLVEKLRSKGLVVRKACLSDRRCVEIVLTEKGENLVIQARKELDNGIINRMNCLNAEETKDLNALLDKLNK